MDEGKEVSERSRLLPTEQLQEDLLNILDGYLPADLRADKGKGKRILSLGCGMAIEAEPLIHLMPEAYYEGIDESEVGLGGARALSPSLPAERFRVADATQSESFGLEPWNLIIIRNPDVDVLHRRSGSNWEQIFRNCYQHLSGEGYLLVTTHKGAEMRVVREYIETHLKGFKVTVPQQKIQDLMRSGFPMSETDLIMYQKKSEAVSQQ